MSNLSRISDELLSGKISLEADLLPPNEDDFRLIGKFIQSYCAADFNGRRFIDAVKAIGGNPNDAFAAKLSDKDVILHVGRCLELPFFSPAVREGLAKAKSAIEMHYEHRHNLAHWAVRRLNGEDIFIALTMSSNQKRQGVSGPLSPGHAQYAIFEPKRLEEELVLLFKHAEYLGRIAVEIESKLNNS